MNHKAVFVSICILVLMLGVCGCMKKPNNDRTVLSASELAKEELKEKYAYSFEVIELSRRSNGPLKNNEYVGYAYLVNRPNEKFTIWVDQEDENVVDSFDCIRINQIANEWIKECAESIWMDSRVEIWSLLVSKPSTSLSEYAQTNIKDYFLNEFSSNDITLFISNYSDNEVEKIVSFLDGISCVRNGIIHINYLDMAEKGELTINLASNRSDIEKQVSIWGNS